MTYSPRSIVALATVTAALAVTVVAGLAGTASAASTSPLPTDSAAKGYVGLCNESGQNVTGGSIDSRPFVWKAVATSAPPSAYQGHGQNAVLGIFQPRTGTVPVEWGGTSLTAASYYHQRATPAAQATYADQSLASVVRRFPPEVNGLYVLRMYFGRTDYGDYSASYPATTIQVTGKSWRVVQGGTVDCRAATAVSSEQLTGVAGAKSTTPRKPSPGEHTVDTTRTQVISLSADSTSTSTSTTSVLVWVLVGLVVVLIVALGAVLRTRRTTAVATNPPSQSSPAPRSSTDKERIRP